MWRGGGGLKRGNYSVNILIMHINIYIQIQTHWYVENCALKQIHNATKTLKTGPNPNPTPNPNPNPKLTEEITR